LKETVELLWDFESELRELKGDGLGNVGCGDIDNKERRMGDIKWLIGLKVDAPDSGNWMSVNDLREI
jgi:hypothetical protein